MTTADKPGRVLTAQDFIDAQEKVLLDDAVNRYYNDALFHYRVDSSVGLALRNRERVGVRKASENECSSYRLGAIFALALDDAMSADKSGRSPSPERTP